MSQTMTLAAAAVAALLLGGCATEPADPISPQQQQALTDENAGGPTACPAATCRAGHREFLISGCSTRS